MKAMRWPHWLVLLLLSVPVPGGAQWLPVAGRPSVYSPVRITSPANHATFFAPVDIPIFAYAYSPSVIYPLYPIPSGIGSFTNVEFFAGTNDLGAGFNLGSTLPPTPIYRPYTSLSNIRLGDNYCLVWSNPPPGSFVLSAVARAAGGESRTSAPVNVTILAAGTNSNAVAVVNVVATDPVAIAGTNAWVWRGMTNVTPAWSNWNSAPLQWFTNWGPKNALFTLQRFGDASRSLTVNYQLGGTASNGVDYAALPGFATVPAGAACVLIPIVPIERHATNSTKTVTLTLTAATNVPPGYLVGYPPRAAAVIWETWLRPLSAVLPDGSFHLAASGPDGAWFYVQYSSDMLNWQPVSTNQVFQGSIDFVDPEAAHLANRFYRAVPVAQPPGQ